MQSKEEALLEAIRANPDDRAAKLVYADWLEEAGDERGEFLRVRLALDGLAGQDERYPALYARWRELRPRIGAAWLAEVDRRSAEDDVREAVFRKTLPATVSRGVIFLQVEGRKDPSPFLLDLLTRGKPFLKPISAARQDPDDGFVDVETGQRGMVQRIDSLRWLTYRECEVEGGYWAGPLAADGNRYQVLLKGGRWQVVRQEMLWIS